MLRLNGFILIGFLVTSSQSVSFHACKKGGELPHAVRIRGCKEDTLCRIPGFSQPTIEYEIDFIPLRNLYGVTVDARIDVKNQELPHISNWKIAPTERLSLKHSDGRVTYFSKIHYVGYDWWLSKAKDQPLKSTLTLPVLVGNQKTYCAEVEIEFYFCLSNCSEDFEEYKDWKKPLNIPPYDKKIHQKLR